MKPDQSVFSVRRNYLIPLILLASLMLVPPLFGNEIKLPYSPAPVDNPLKGLVPYARPTPGRFPHSMEFNYLPLSDLMTGYDSFNWEPLEELLNDIASRRHQTIFRIWMEYPGHEEGIPDFLVADGLKVTSWKNTNTAPFPPEMVRTPDYSDPRMRKALRNFILALGAKYDGDPRIGFITAGLLGTWGEWHTYPREELMASKEVQIEIMQAYDEAFKTTPILLRYPAGSNAWSIAANHDRPFGYHDDSFAWATLDTGRKEDDWFYMAALKQAGLPALSKWKTQPIGGEIRPELWGSIFDGKQLPDQAQNFSQCVQETHASWLMDTGMFQEKPSRKRRQNAIQEVQRMGYEFHIESVEWGGSTTTETEISLRVNNKGVAPFYYDWKVELGVFKNDELTETIPTDWSLTELLPDSPPRIWRTILPRSNFNPSQITLAVRVVNPLKNGLPLRFANEPSSVLPPGWLYLGTNEEIGRNVDQIKESETLEESLNVACEGAYPRHLQGIAKDEDSIYWSFTTEFVKTDLQGKVLKKIPVANHHGDLCYSEGKIFVAVNLGNFNDPKGNADSWVYVYDAENLKELARHEVQEVFHGAGGIGVRSGNFFVVGGLPTAVDENYVYEYDINFQFVKKHVISSGHTHLGIQTATFAHDRWWFGCYGSPAILLVTDAKFQMQGRYEFNCSLGIEKLPNGKLLAASGACTKDIGCAGKLRTAVPDEKTGLKYVSTKQGNQ